MVITLGAGVIFGFGVVSGLVLAGLAFLIYLSLRNETVVAPDLEAATARVRDFANRTQTGATKVQDASTKVAGIEPGE